jgi:anti-anti-sigma factor
MSQDLEIIIGEENGVRIINLVGDVTAVTGQLVEDAYNEISNQGAGKIVLDFAGDNYLNSGGIAFLIGIAAESQGKGQVIRVAGLSDHFHKIFDMMGLTRYMDLFPTLESAMEGFEE